MRCGTIRTKHLNRNRFMKWAGRVNLEESKGNTRIGRNRLKTTSKHPDASWEHLKHPANTMNLLFLDFQFFLFSLWVSLLHPSNAWCHVYLWTSFWTRNSNVAMMLVISRTVVAVELHPAYSTQTNQLPIAAGLHTTRDGSWRTLSPRNTQQNLGTLLDN